ncbi:hypothetical protein H6F86_07885 [Phormidium sp. FACHB-592]|uniref:Uncharacterized protein n=1 Tax=Stenomitos frigidus AS-A4 TaxID=2933935 RepID=A0ABV0KGX8_9CYAN|nr:hypothetical protein [Phormidium sp. FACHB-592]MBD2073807.1 hypothetical protein [Phormidium sp. FACHB-592]
MYLLERLTLNIGHFQSGGNRLVTVPDVIAIPKASNPKHLRENRTTLVLTLTTVDLAKPDAHLLPTISGHLHLS